MCIEPPADFIRTMLTLARERYGMYAKGLFQEWGLKTSRDIGVVIHSLAKEGLLAVSEEDIQTLMEEFLNKPGASVLLQPRELIRGIIFILDLMKDHPETKFSDYCKKAVENVGTTSNVEIL